VAMICGMLPIWVSIKIDSSVRLRMCSLKAIPVGAE
jgi:hypothetical protein